MKMRTENTAFSVYNDFFLLLFSVLLTLPAHRLNIMQKKDEKLSIV